MNDNSTSTLQTDSNDDGPLWGARAIGAFLGLKPRQAVYLLEQGKLPATKVGPKWLSTKRALRTLFPTVSA